MGEGSSFRSDAKQDTLSHPTKRFNLPFLPRSLKGVVYPTERVQHQPSEGKHDKLVGGRQVQCFPNSGSLITIHRWV